MAQVDLHVERGAPALQRRLSEQPTRGDGSHGNRLTLYSDGDEAFRVMHRAILNARERVWLETYILEPDEVGLAVMEALTDAARRGCDVILLYDRWGSPKVRTRHTAPIREAGGRVAVFNPLLPFRKIGRQIGTLLHRDHRKILIADSIGFCGGYNVSAEYGGPGPEVFYDLLLRVEGPEVRALAGVLLESYHDATGEHCALPPPVPPVHANGAFAQALALDAREDEQGLNRAVRQALREAEKRCYLITPYFVPPPWFIEELGATSERGVDVRVLTAGRSDVPAMRVAGRHIYGPLLQRGVRIYEMQHPLLHAKALTLDGVDSIVGSYNVDQYGSRHNQEVGLATEDPGLAADLEREFKACLTRSREVDYAWWNARPPLARLAQWLLYQAATRL